MEVNLTGNLWGMPFELMGQIGTKEAEQSNISLIDQISFLDVLLTIFAIIFIVYILKYRVIPLFGEFWYYQETRPISKHEGERFIFKTLRGEFLKYKPTHDREFWREYLQIYEEILSPLRKELQSQTKLANWMLAISGGTMVLMASNFDKFLTTEINFQNMPFYMIPDKILFLFILLMLAISTSFHFSSKLHIYYLEGDLETELAYIPLLDGIRNIEDAKKNIAKLKADLESMEEAKIPPGYSSLVSRFESIERNLDIRRANIWRKFQIGNAFFIVGLISLILFYLFYIIFS